MCDTDPTGCKNTSSTYCVLVCFFVDSVLVPPEHEKKCVDDSHPRMHYVTSRSHRMQKHKFGVTCSGVLFLKSVSIPPEHEK
jgi:hypothetical protein